MLAHEREAFRKVIMEWSELLPARVNADRVHLIEGFSAVNWVKPLH